MSSANAPGGRPRRVVRWGEAVAEARLSAAVHFQRLTSGWLDQVRSAAREAGVIPVVLGGASIDPFDQLRSPLLVRGAAALTMLQSIEAVLGRYPLDSHELVDLPSSPEFNELLARFDRSFDVLAHRSTEAGKSLVQTLRSQAYEIKRRLQRTLGLKRSVPASGRPIVLAVPRLDGQVTDMLPVADELRQSHGIETVFAIVDNRLAKRIRRSGYACVGLYNGPGAETRAARRQGGELIGRLTRFLAASPTDERIGAQASDALAREAANVLRCELADAVQLAHSFERLIRAGRPAVVLAGNPYTLEGRTAALVAKQLGVPAAAMEHGTIFADSPVWYDCPVDLVCAWGEPSRRALLSNGLSDAQIRVTGAPRYDEVFRQSRERADRKFILVATSGPGDQVNLDQHRYFIRALFDAATATPDISWVVKLHPKDREDYYQGADGATPSNVVVTRAEVGPQGLGVFGYLREARGLVTVTSSCALDAMAVGVPVITFDVWAEGQTPRGIEFLHRGCTRHVRTGSDLAAEARRAWRGEEDAATRGAAESYAAEHFVERGTAATAVAKELTKLVGRT